MCIRGSFHFEPLCEAAVVVGGWGGRRPQSAPCKGGKKKVGNVFPFFLSRPPRCTFHAKNKCKSLSQTNIAYIWDAGSLKCCNVDSVRRSDPVCHRCALLALPDQIAEITSDEMGVLHHLKASKGKEKYRLESRSTRPTTLFCVLLYVIREEFM